MGFTADIATNLYTTSLGNTPKSMADATVKIGGESLTKFVPNVNMTKWQDEAWININNKNVVVTNEAQSFADNKIDLIIGNDCHRYYIDANGHLEYEIIFSSQPKSEIFLDLQFSQGLDFFYQPALTVKEIASGYIRPENIIGSYAVYWKKNWNKYQTGKFCHICRPKFIDAKGASIWGELFIDQISGIISIKCDEKWLSLATYPVTLDPTIGYSTEGASSVFHSYGNAESVHSTSEGAGVTSTINVSIHSGNGGSCKMALYTDDTGNNRPESQLPDGSGDDEVSVSLASLGWNSANYVQNISALTKYWCAIADIGGSSTYWHYDTGSANSEHSFSLGSTDLPASWADSGTNSTKLWSMYADYVEAGGGQPISKRFGAIPFVGLNKGVF